MPKLDLDYLDIVDAFLLQVHKYMEKVATKYYTTAAKTNEHCRNNNDNPIYYILEVFVLGKQS